MRPKQPTAEPQDDLFRARLENLVDRRHPLVRLAGLIDWGRFETEFGPLYADAIGRPGLPTRLMVGLHLLKHLDGLSDEAACARYLDSPYAQLFCGEAHFRHALPLDRSSMTRWRQRGASGSGPSGWKCCWPRAWPRRSEAAPSKRSTFGASPSTPRSRPKR
jgi:IS5 family transposase